MVFFLLLPLELMLLDQLPLFFFWHVLLLILQYLRLKSLWILYYSTINHLLIFWPLLLENTRLKRLWLELVGVTNEWDLLNLLCLLGRC